MYPRFSPIPSVLRRGVVLAGAALLLGTAGCGQDEATPELTRFESCSELETWIRASAFKDIDFVYPPGIALPGAMAAEDSAMGGSPRSAGAPTESVAQGGAVQGDSGNHSYSTTNVQEDGVDEADFVKNDGDHIFVLDRSGLSIIDAWPAEQMHQVSRFEVEGTPSSLYFDAVDTVVVFSTLNGGVPNPDSGAGDFDAPAPAETWWDPITKVTILDVTDRSAPALVREAYFDGELRSSRRVGDRIHLVLTEYLNDFYSSALNDSRVAARQAVRASVHSDWLPRLQDNVKTADGWVTSESPLTACTDVYRPNVRTELFFSGIVTIDLADAGSALQSVGVFTRADTVYASTDSLYLAMSEYEEGPFRSLDGSVDSRIHKLDIGDGAPLYTASGIVEGTMLNSFSMDEQDGYLRVATNSWTNGVGPQGGESSNNVFVVEQDGTSLDVAGSVTHIAPGESIYAVRFLGDRGFVVTFEQIDPLFTLDLSDPRNPEIVGQLEVTGFSNYLHPMDDDHLIAVGEEMASNGWEQMGLQVSLFDVSNFASPVLSDREIVEANGSSEAQYDHHAFTWYADYDMLALPVTRWNYEGYGNSTGLELFRITAEEGIESAGEIDHSAYLPSEQDDYWYYGCNNVRRSIFIEDYVFAVSNLAIQVAMLETPDVTVSGLAYEDGGCPDYYYGEMAM